MVLTPPAARHHSERCLLEAPKFTDSGGVFAELVTVGITCEPGSRVRYIVERLPDGAETGTKGRHTVMATEGLLYRRPVVLDEYGCYLVHAMCMREEDKIEVSAITSQRYEVRPTDVQALQGTHLAALPKQMVRGFFHFAGATAKAIAPRLATMRRAVAHAAKTAEECVSVCIKKSKDGKARGGDGVKVSFSVQVGRDSHGESVRQAVTDPSLVECIAQATGLSCKKVTVEATAKPLEEVLLHLEWTFPIGSHDYLDGSCLVYAEDRLLDAVDYRGAQSVNRSGASGASCEWSAGRGEAGVVVHSGDVMSRKGGRHAILVKLSQLPAAATECFFTLSAYHCRNLSKFVAPRVRFFDAEDTRHLLTEYNLGEAGGASAAVVCSLARETGQGNAWSVVAFGQTCDGTVRDYRPIEAAIAPVQAKYDNWRRRAPLVQLSWLWHSHRALPRATAEREEAVMPLLDLEPDLFRHVVSFL